MLVSPGAPSAATSSIIAAMSGSGLESAVVGVPASFLVTIRDSWGNTVYPK